jgi:protein gp37
MGDTAIEWTDKTWNPTVGCSKVGNDPACANCYAIPQAHRIQLMGGKGGQAYEGTTVEKEIRRPGSLEVIGEELDWSGRVNELPDRLQVADWKDPKLVFVNSMSDLFHGSVSREFVAEVFKVMASRPRHVFQILTKRPTRMAALMADTEFIEMVGAEVWPLPNVWLGTSIGSDAFAERADVLRAIDWPTRFLSLEPLVAPVESLDYSGIHWVIVGGESITRGGEDAMRRIRPMHPEWVREIRDAVDAHNYEWAHGQCPYYRHQKLGHPLDAPGMEGGYGPGTCSMGCVEEPGCVTGQWGDYPEHSVALLFKQWGNWEPLGNLQDWLDNGGSGSEPGILIANRNGRNRRGTADGSLSNHLGYFTGESGDDEWVFKWRPGKFHGRELDDFVHDAYPDQLIEHMEAHR